MTTFKGLHYQGSSFLLGNAWDPGSALIMEQKGFPAIGTTSWGVANRFGYKDDEKIGFEKLTEHVSNILQVISVPLTIDLEEGYAASSSEILEHALVIARIGCAGINIEDSLPNGSLKEEVSHASLIEAIREELTSAGY